MLTDEERKEHRRESNRRAYYAHREKNLIRARAYGKEYRKAYPEKIRADNLFRPYGVSVEAYNTMLQAQGGKCVICGRPDSGVIKGGKYVPMFVDHDHVTGKVRGLLCNQCNRDIGWVESAGTNGKEELLREYLRQNG